MIEWQWGAWSIKVIWPTRVPDLLTNGVCLSVEKMIDLVEVTISASVLGVGVAIVRW
jgi:hypothetical protein